MSFWKGNMDNVQENTAYEILKPGEYNFRISKVEKTQSRSGDPMAKIILECTEAKHRGAKVWDNILFPLPDSPSIKILGRSKSFLKAIGEPYEGDVEVVPENWIEKAVKARTETDYYTDRTGKEREKALVAEYIPIDWKDVANDVAWDE